MIVKDGFFYPILKQIMNTFSHSQINAGFLIVIKRSNLSLFFQRVGAIGTASANSVESDHGGTSMIY